jgi:hypothetical protein
MTTRIEPRLVEMDTEVDDGLRALLRAAREDGPRPAERADVAARVVTVLGIGGLAASQLAASSSMAAATATTASAGTTAAAGSTAAATAGAAAGTTAPAATAAGAAAVGKLVGFGVVSKTVLVLAVAMAAGGGIYSAVRRNAHQHKPPVITPSNTHLEPAPVAPAPVPPPVLPAPVEPEPARPAFVEPARRPDVPVRAPSSRMASGDPAVLQGALRELHSGNYSRALAIIDDNHRSIRGTGLEQEGEVIAIEALVGMRRMDRARRRAARFERRFPESAHLRRLQVVLENADAEPEP